VNWLRVFENHAKAVAIWENGREATYSDLGRRILELVGILKGEGIAPGAVVFVKADYCFESIACLFALAELRCIVAPYSGSDGPGADALGRLAQCDAEIVIDGSGLRVKKLKSVTNHPLIVRLKGLGAPGLILFTSGSSGEPRAIVHSLDDLFSRFVAVKPKPKRIAAFLLFDHMGGLHTLFMTLAMGGGVVILKDRAVHQVIDTLRASGAQILPCTPSFLRLMLTYAGGETAPIKSLEMITYGTEPMPPAVLERLLTLFPSVKFKQTYGLTEVGVLPTRSPDRGSTFFQVGDQETQIRILNGELQVKAKTAMMGYLNAPSPFTEDGWLKTGDMVEEKDGLIRVLGRDSRIINIGGLKVHPTEIENVISDMPEVEDVIVAQEKHPLLGEIAVSHVKLTKRMDLLDFTALLRKHCATRFEAYKIPQKIVLHEEPLHNERFKKRNLDSGG